MTQLTLFPSPLAYAVVGAPTECRPQAYRVPVYRVALVRETSLPAPGPRLRSAVHAAAFLRQYLGAVDREHFVVMLLDRKNAPIGLNTVSIGSLTASIVHMRAKSSNLPSWPTPLPFSAAITTRAATPRPAGKIVPSRSGSWTQGSCWVFPSSTISCLVMARPPSLASRTRDCCEASHGERWASTGGERRDLARMAGAARAEDTLSPRGLAHCQPQEASGKRGQTPRPGRHAPGAP